MILDENNNILNENHDQDSENMFTIFLTSVCHRESWKYGNRALRSCYLNSGHAIAALGVSANIHGLEIGLMDDGDLNFGRKDWLNNTNEEVFEIGLRVGGVIFQFQHTYFRCSFNTHISGAVSTHTFQVQFQHTHFRYSDVLLK